MQAQISHIEAVLNRAPFGDLAMSFANLSGKEGFIGSYTLDPTPPILADSAGNPIINRLPFSTKFAVETSPGPAAEPTDDGTK